MKQPVTCKIAARFAVVAVVSLAGMAGIVFALDCVAPRVAEAAGGWALICTVAGLIRYAVTLSNRDAIR